MRAQDPGDKIDMWINKLSRDPSLFGALGGILTALLYVVLFVGSLVSDGVIKALCYYVHIPLGLFIDWCAVTFKGGNTDQMLGVWPLLLPLYWIVTSAGVGIIFYTIAVFRNSSGKGSDLS
jgi:hypothetical protein